MDINKWTIDFPCPECQQTFRVTLDQMAEGGVMVCPTCKLTNAEAELTILEQELENLNKSIQNLKRCLEINAHLNPKLSN